MSRSEPTLKTVKMLFALSGNQCAFPHCRVNIVDKNGTVIGEICHIEAAEPGGPRYNADQTHDERRSFQNLILLCANHHQVIDDDEKYTVDGLRRMKNRHEKWNFDNRYEPPERAVLESLARISYIEREPRSALISVFRLLTEADKFADIAVVDRGICHFLVDSHGRRKEVCVQTLHHSSLIDPDQEIRRFRDQCQEWVRFTKEYDVEFFFLISQYLKFDRYRVENDFDSPHTVDARRYIGHLIKVLREVLFATRFESPIQLALGTYTHDGKMILPHTREIERLHNELVEPHFWRSQSMPIFQFFKHEAYERLLNPPRRLRV